MDVFWFIALLILLALVVLVLVPWLLATAHRLDRLHVRIDAAWTGLDAALARRAVVVRTMVAGDPHAGSLRELADTAERADRVNRESAENALTRDLSALDRQALPPALADELVDSEHRVVLARRMYNDAVRDTLALRRRRAVRWLKLAGTAGRPAYFEIAEPDIDSTAHPGSLIPRRAARVLLIDPDRRILLFSGHASDRPDKHWWFTPGGGVEPGEHLRETAAREVSEETGIMLDPDGLIGPVWRRQALMEFDGALIAGDEWFFLARIGHREVDISGFTALEQSTVDDHRWWPVDDLASTEETIYPEQLAELLPDLLASEWDGRLRRMH